MIKKIGGWGNFIFVLLFILVFSYSFFKKNKRTQNAGYVKGISLGVSQGVRGNVQLNYVFAVGTSQFEGFMPSSFCKECSNCCDAGDTVIVRYEKDNPKNNDLVVELPTGAILEKVQ